MKAYESDDVVTFYFIVLSDGSNRRIGGWTDSKGLAEAYMEFHSCKGMTMKSITKPFHEIVEILNENTNDEIQIFNITIRDRSKQKKHQDNTKTIPIPATQVEIMFINDESANFMYDEINYSYLNSAMPYLKNKYQRALNHLFLPDIIRKVLHQQASPLVQSIRIDQLSLFVRLFPEQFG